MSKKQKIWLGVFLAMFIVPEILWSPIINDLYEYSQSSRPGTTYSFMHTFLQHNDNINILSTVLFIQMAGLLFSSIYLIIARKNIKNKIALWAFCLLLFLMAVVVFFLFGFSVSLRHIGF